MSAIFGIYDLKGRPVDPTWIKSMQEDLAHRGPDGQGIYKEDSLVLGHLLLQVTPESIYDQSPFEEADFVITANARLDEREALMDRLQIAAEEREKTTDPMLLLWSYRKWGKAFVKDIYGDFSFAIWDRQTKELFCARDQMGVKPFLYYFQDGRFVFSTELKAIVRLPFVETEIDQLYLRDRAIGIGDTPNKTTWKDITRLSAAHTLSFNGLDLNINQYWKPVYKQNPQFKTAEQSATALREILQRVIADHTRVMGMVGVPLSGGLDSGTIACLAARKMALEGKQIVTASSVLHPEFKEPGVKDEMEYIQAILNQEKNIDATFVYNTDLEFLVNMEEKFNRHYAPVNNFYYVDEGLYQNLKEKSVRRMLSGFLGDMTASNSTISPLPHLLLTGRLYDFFKVGRSIKKKVGYSWFTFLKHEILIPVIPMALLKLGYYFKKTAAPWYIDTLPLSLTPTEQKSLQKRKTGYFRNYLKYQADIAKNIWPSSLELIEEDFDCGSSFHKLEVSYPLIDRRIVEFLLQIPVEHFYADGLKRGLIRKSMEQILPEKIKKRTGKNPYSPAYHHIVQKYLLTITQTLKAQQLKTGIGDMLDYDKLDIQLKNIVISETSHNFTGSYFSYLNICSWINFANWSIIKKRK